jgi:hypothetical protein
MKKYYTIGGLILAGITLLVISLIGFNQPTASNATVSLAKLVALGGMASTSPVFFSPQALSNLPATSTTATLNISGAEAIDLNIQLNASSTTSQLRWTEEYSYDGIDWFMQDKESTTNNVVTHYATATSTVVIYHTWTPGAIGISRKNVKITDIDENYLRLTFSAHNGTSSVWALLVENKPF